VKFKNKLQVISFIMYFWIW